MKKRLELSSDPSRDAMDSAMALLKYRGRSEAEMAQSLKKKGFAADVVDSAIHRLKELLLLNDEELARVWTQARRREGKGELRIRQWLGQRGITRPVIDRVLTNTPGDKSELQRAQAALQSRVKRLGRVDAKTLYRRLGGYLSRQGFSLDIIQTVLGKYLLRLTNEEERSNDA